MRRMYELILASSPVCTFRASITSVVYSVLGKVATTGSIMKSEVKKRKRKRRKHSWLWGLWVMGGQ